MAVGGDRLKQAVSVEVRARELEAGGHLEEAFHEYKSCLQVFHSIYCHEQNFRVKDLVKERLEQVVGRAEALKKKIDSSSSPQFRHGFGHNGSAAMEQRLPPTQGQEETGAAQTSGVAQASGAAQPPREDSELTQMKRQMETTILSSKPNVKWSDIAGLSTAKAMLQETVILPTKFPKLFQDAREPWKGILLYGPPGTGKSYLAMACATEAKSTFFNITSAELVSKYQGESEKQVKALFQLARDQSPSIIFIDEIDSLCASRGDGESDGSRRIKTEFLTQMDGVGNDMRGVLTLGATNCPWDLDQAIRRRFEKRIYISLPEAEARKVALKIQLGNTKHELSDEDFQSIAKRTEGLSAADIKILVRDASFEPVRRCQRAMCFKQIVTASGSGSELVWTPCSPGAPGAVEKGLMDIPAEELEAPGVLPSDFDAAIERTRSSVGLKDLTAYENWTSTYGMDG